MVNRYTVDVENPSSWDEYFYRIALIVASNSKCLSRKIGAVITIEHTIISTGYNGPSRDVRKCDERWLVDEKIRRYVIERQDDLDALESGRYEEFREMENLINTTPHNKMSMIKMISLYKTHLEGKCPRYIPEMGFKSGEGLNWCIAGHAERNAIINVARHGLHALKGATLYVTWDKICTPCLVEIKNAGIEEIVSPQEDIFYDVSGEYQLRESGIRVRKYDFIKE